MTVFKNIIFTFVVPGTITVLIPYRLLTPSYTRLRRGAEVDSVEAAVSREEEIERG